MVCARRGHRNGRNIIEFERNMKSLLCILRETAAQGVFAGAVDSSFFFDGTDRFVRGLRPLGTPYSHVDLRFCPESTLATMASTNPGCVTSSSVPSKVVKRPLATSREPLSTQPLRSISAGQFAADRVPEFGRTMRERLKGLDRLGGYGQVIPYTFMILQVQIRPYLRNGSGPRLKFFKYCLAQVGGAFRGNRLGLNKYLGEI
ncbi:hypothetical protein C8R44DRAFT_421212 [Mycena epipterygia]|nr:hypothetical protein C8R44DRAFT_421212 [Mycena epipterygia]